MAGMHDTKKEIEQLKSLVFVVSDEGLGGILPFGRKIREAGYLPVLLTGESSVHKLVEWQKVYAEAYILPNPYDPKILVEHARKIAGPNPIAGFFSCFDGLILPAAIAASKLGLPHPNLKGIAQSRNKCATRCVLEECGLSNPRFGLISCERDAERIAEDVGFPAIIKPLNGLASHLVRRVEDTGTLRRAFHELKARISTSFSGNYSRTACFDDILGELIPTNPLGTFLVEQYLDGPEYSAEVVIRDGTVDVVALFHKFIMEYDRFFECGFTQPGFELTQTLKELIFEYMEDCLSALEVNQTVAHVEVICTKLGPILLEVNAGRPGGQIIVAAVREGFGVDLLEETLAVTNGIPRPRTSKPSLTGQLTTLTVFPPKSGRIERIDGLDEISQLPGVVKVFPFCAPGDIIDAKDKEIFAINLLVNGIDKRDELESLYHDACRLVQFKISPNISK